MKLKIMKPLGIRTVTYIIFHVEIHTKKINTGDNVRISKRRIFFVNDCKKIGKRKFS